MAIATGNSTVLVVDAKLRGLIAADCTTAINSLALRPVVTARTTRAASFDIPSSVRIRNDMVRLRSSAHFYISFYLYKRIKSSV